LTDLTQKAAIFSFLYVWLWKTNFRKNTPASVLRHPVTHSDSLSGSIFFSPFSTVWLANGFL